MTEVKFKWLGQQEKTQLLSPPNHLPHLPIKEDEVDDLSIFTPND
tara:strand:- start:38 stop:172 length:135 start_codon:yes stop_codon:yes gene_type:complete